jgi:hypothetical protein
MIGIDSGKPTANTMPKSGMSSIICIPRAAFRPLQ